MNDSLSEDTRDLEIIEEHIDDEGKRNKFIKNSISNFFPTFFFILESVDLRSIIYDEDSSLRVYDVLLTLGFGFMYEKFKGIISIS